MNVLKILIVYQEIDMATTWRKMLREVLPEGETIIHCTLTPKELDEQFDGGYGLTEGRPFTAWSENWVFFPIGYDGAEKVGKAPRNPCNIKMSHQGG
jgi:hypothetical protein